jgi:hypothetical protein
MSKTFDHLLILGRPAAGKSEFIDFMKKTEDRERADEYHIGKFKVVDDFFWLWEKFLEDDMWEQAGYDRIFSNKAADGNYNVKIPDQLKLYDFLFAKFNYKINKEYLSNPSFYDDGTLFIEFARGRENAYKNSLSRLSRPTLEKAAILYVQVDFEESWRRNVARYQEKLKHSSLAHMAPRETMEAMYFADDWKELTNGKETGYLDFHGVKIPFVTMNNTPELKEREPLALRYGPHLKKLFDIWRNR